MVDYPYPASFLAPLPAYPVTVACHSLLNTPNRLRGLAQAAGKTLSCPSPLCSHLQWSKPGVVGWVRSLLYFQVSVYLFQYVISSCFVCLFVSEYPPVWLSACLAYYITLLYELVKLSSVGSWYILHSHALTHCLSSGLFYNGTTGHLSCFNITSEFIECADPTGCGTGPASLSWDYQVSGKGSGSTTISL